VPDLREAGTREPFTLVVELEAWNIRERNREDWGRTESLRQRAKNRSGGGGRSAPKFDLSKPAGQL